MSNPGPTKEDYDTLLYKLATLERELDQARKLLEALSGSRGMIISGLWRPVGTRP